MRVLVDPGHGGRDSGAVSGDGSLLEKHVVLKIARRVDQLLVPHGAVEMSRDDDTFLTLTERASMANVQDLDLLSIHCNAGGGHGFEVFTSPEQTRSDSWATAVLKELAEEFPERRIRSDFRDGDPDKEARFTVLTRTKRAAILVECGFVDTEEGEAFLRDPKNQERLAMAIAKGTLRANGKTPREIKPKDPAAKPSPAALTLEDRVKALEEWREEIS